MDTELIYSYAIKNLASDDIEVLPEIEEALNGYWIAAKIFISREDLEVYTHAGTGFDEIS